MNIRRIVPVLLLAALGITVFGSVTAKAKSYRKQLRWLTSSTTFQGLTGDSLTFAEGSGQNCDTSMAIAIHEITPGWGQPGRVTASDTTQWFALQLVESGTSEFTESSDTLHVGTQVSQDGLNWVTITPGILFYATGKDGTLNGAILMEKAANTYTLNYYINILLGRVNVATQGATTAPTHLQLGDWAYARFIVQGDMTGSWAGYVQGHWTD